MKITISEIHELAKALQEISGNDLPIVTAFKIAKLQKKFNEELENAEKIRINLIEKLGTKDEKGVFSVNKENIPLFEEEMIKLFKHEVELDMPTFKVSEFGEIKIKPSVASIFSKIIE